LDDGNNPSSREQGMSEQREERVPPLGRWWLDPVAGPITMLTALITRGDPPRIFTTLARHPRLFRHWLPFAGSLLLRTELPRADVELIILRTAWNCSSRYEWTQHVGLAVRAGVSHDAIERIPGGPADDAWTTRQALLLGAVDELHKRRVISDATWTALAEELPERQLIELCFLVGHYEMLAMTLNSLGVRPEARARERLAGPAAEAAETLRRRLVAARRSGLRPRAGPRR
jgi:alkylhydroperoxidase family enzyme